VAVLLDNFVSVAALAEAREELARAARARRLEEGLDPLRRLLEPLAQAQLMCKYS
jgi:hypothetical protein